MQCRTCGAPLPTGAANCPSCGAATPYNQSIPPTSYGSPPPPPSNSSYPYGSPSPYESSPYDRTTASSPYGNSYPQQQAPTPVPPQQGGLPQYNNIPAIPNYPQMPQPPKKNNTPIIVTSVAVAAVLVIVLLVFVVPKLGQGGQTQSTPTPVVNAATPTPTQAEPTPTPTQSDNTQVDPDAQKIITNATTASEINQDTYKPTQKATTFKADQSIYITFDLNVSQDGYVYIEYYEDNDRIETDHLAVNTDHSNGYFGIKYLDAGQGEARLYWCTKSDFSDAKLAQTVTFTVTD